AAPVLSPGTPCPEGRPSPLPLGEPQFKAVVTQAAAALSSLLDQLRLHPTPPVRVAVALIAPDTGLALPPGVLCEEGSLPQEETQAWARPHEALAQDGALTALGKVLYLLDRILDGQVSSGMAATPVPAAAATLDVAVRYGLSHGAQRLLCVAVGQLDRPPGLTDDGYDSRVMCTSSFTSGWLEADVRSLISGEESLCRDLVRKTRQVMESAPGTGLPAVGLFSYGDPCWDRFERDTRVSLFGALVHSRTADLDVRLDLPPVPDSADLSGLAIKVPPSVDQSEDEGFQSASNLTPDSQSEPGVTPDIDLWDAVLTYEASKRRCWEQVGCPPGHREEPYLTEAGRDAFDRFCRLRQGELQVLGGSLLQAPQPVLVKECELVKDALNVLIGVVSATFSLCQVRR
ncbi:PREDICTED: gamma-tubulin complex component 6-like, partial [Bison bison bison]|uniref:Gamma-tubulin complex component n=1 Tax=Bison bison bison TaxID=43346 RepID=A0A6P3H6Y7_BISBB